MKKMKRLIKLFWILQILLMEFDRKEFSNLNLVHKNKIKKR